MKLGCKLSSFNNLPTSFPKSDQLCLKHVKNTYSLFLDWYKNRDYIRIPDRSPVVAGDALHCRLCRGYLCSQIAKKVDGWHIFVHCSL